jgi:capsular polysaccharide biosynthesis protein
MELKAYINIVIKRWPIILAITVVVFLLSIGYAIKYTGYEAESSLQIITPLGGSMDYTYYDTTYADRMINTISQIATSDGMKKELEGKLGIASLPDISVKIIPDSEIIQIAVDSRNPALAAQAANALAELIVSNQSRMAENSGISDELALLNNQKTALETPLAQDQQEYETIVKSLSLGEAQLTVLDGTIQMKRTSYQNLYDRYQTALLGSDANQTNSLNKELSDLQKQIDSLAQQYQDLSTSTNDYSDQVLLARQTIQNDQTALSNLQSQYNTVLGAQARTGRSQNVQIVGQANVPTKPTLSRSFILILGLLGGLICGIVIAFIYNNLDPNFFHPTKKA